MAERSSFFDSINRDRVYYAADFASHLAEYFTNGIFNNGLMVVANNDMTVSVKTGSANINGYKYKLDTNPKRISVSNADGILNRIDNIVIRLDLPDRKITTEIVQGSFAENPIAPALKRGTSIYDLRIAKISVPAGTTEITQDLITDCRFNSDDCGNVICAVQTPDFTDISKQYDTVFNKWFDNVKTVLSGDVAGNLKLEINKLSEDLKDEMDAEKTKIEELNNTVSRINNDVGKMNLLKIQVTDRGTNNNGSYIRYSDGTMRCWKIVEVEAGGTKWENLYYSDHNMGRWAKEFKTLISSKATVFSKQFWCTQENQTCENAGTVRCFRPNANTTSVTISIEAWGYYIEDHNNLQNIDRVYTLEGSTGTGSTYG